MRSARLRYLARAGRVPGAMQLGTGPRAYWIFPADVGVILADRGLPLGHWGEVDPTGK